MMNSDQFDLNNLLNKQQAGMAPPPGPDVPILGQSQSVPVFAGLPVGPNQLLPAEAVLKMSEREFRELMMAVLVGMMGGMYVPPEKVDELKEDGTLVPVNEDDEPSEDNEDTVESPEALDEEE
jgi:hypothetical protein